MQLDNLLGRHTLSGVDYLPDYDGQGSNGVMFVLDGTTLALYEDPSDGYRSFAGEVSVTTDKVKNTFTPQEVEITKQDGYNINEIADAYTVVFTDVITGATVLELGTDYSDEYYPVAVLHWQPENLSCNQSLEK